MNKKRKAYRNKIKRIRFFTIIGVLVLVVTVSARENQPQVVGYTYDTGNTIWEMAQRNCPKEIDVRDVVREIEKLNNIENAVVHNGVFYKIPVYKK